VPFFDVDQLADRVIEALTHPQRFKSLRARARETIVNNFDMRHACLPKLLRVLGLEPSRRPTDASDRDLVSVDEVA
jgi:hypothetical protein